MNCRAKKELDGLPSSRLHPALHASHKDAVEKDSPAVSTMEVDQDPIHCLVKSKPRLSPLALVRRLKQASTLQLWQVYEGALRRHVWKERTFWSDGYVCCTLGNASQETRRQYLESQG
ncbi:MAG TPA: IS200/IS605 family transposase [Ktedonobacteraceae bacterium]